MARRKKRTPHGPMEHVLVWTISVGILPLTWGGWGLVVGLIVASAWIVYTMNE